MSRFANMIKAIISITEGSLGVLMRAILCLLLVLLLVGCGVVPPPVPGERAAQGSSASSSLQDANDMPSFLALALSLADKIEQPTDEKAQPQFAIDEGDGETEWFPKDIFFDRTWLSYLLDPSTSWNASACWEEVETPIHVGDETAIYYGSPQTGYAVFPLEDGTADILFVTSSFEPVLALKRILKPYSFGEDKSLKEVVINKFSVEERSFSRIRIPMDVPKEDIPEAVMELYCKNMMQLSAVNPYRITEIEFQSVSGIDYFDNGETIDMDVIYALKPVDINFPDWYSGGGPELLEGSCSGWMRFETRVTGHLNSENGVWYFQS